MGKVRRMITKGKERSARLLVQILYSKDTAFVHIDEERLASFGSYTNKR
jgi:hypothetical protein